MCKRLAVIYKLVSSFLHGESQDNYENKNEKVIKPLPILLNLHKTRYNISFYYKV